MKKIEYKTVAYVPIIDEDGGTVPCLEKIKPFLVSLESLVSWRDTGCFWEESYELYLADVLAQLESESFQEILFCFKKGG